MRSCSCLICLGGVQLLRAGWDCNVCQSLSGVQLLAIHARAWAKRSRCLLCMPELEWGGQLPDIQAKVCVRILQLPGCASSLCAYEIRGCMPVPYV